MHNLIRKLAQLTCFEQVKQICPVASGQSLFSFKVQTSQAMFFAKHIGASSTAQVETICATAAAQQGFAPSLHYLDEQWLVTHFIDGVELGLSTLYIKDKLSVASCLLNQCHQLTLNLPRLNIGRTIKVLLDHCHYQTEQLNWVNDIAQQLANNITVTPQVVCHGDANFANMLISLEKKAYLLDFECACLADREFDLAMLLAINELDDSCFSAVSRLYQVSEKSPLIDNALVMCYLPFCHLINALWYFNKSKQRNNAQLYQQALKQFDHFDQFNVTPKSLAQQMR